MKQSIVWVSGAVVLLGAVALWTWTEGPRAELGVVVPHDREPSADARLAPDVSLPKVDAGRTERVPVVPQSATESEATSHSGVIHDPDTYNPFDHELYARIRRDMPVLDRVRLATCEDAHVAFAAREAFVQDERSPDWIRAYLKDGSTGDEELVVALDGVCLLGAARFQEELAELTRSCEFAFVRQRALRLVDAPGVELLQDALNDSDWSVRAIALDQVLQSPEAATKLIERIRALCDDDELLVRSKARDLVAASGRTTQPNLRP